MVVYKISGKDLERQHKISAFRKVNVSEEFMGEKRLKTANEISIQENIKRFLKRLNMFVEN